MTIPSKTQQQFIQDMIASWGGSAGVVPDLSPGDFLLAIFESVSAQLDFLQAQAFLVLLLTRASTSTSADLDTWMADFDFARLAATFAVGPVTLIKNTTAASPVVVPAATLINGIYQGGTLVQTTGGAVTYQLIPDINQSTYNSISNAYVMPIGATTITVTAQAVIAGSVSNVVAGALTQLGSQQGGIDSVSNTVPISNGSDQESDANYRARFILYLSTLAKATRSAILAAALGVQQGLQIALAENQMADGTPLLGSFTVFVDDGTGAPPASLLAAVEAAEDQTRAFGVQAFVAAPNIQNATVVITVRLATGIQLGTIQASVQNAVATVAEALVPGQTLFVSAIEQAVLALSGIISIKSGTTINSVPADLVPSTTTEIRVQSTGVSVGSY